MLGPGGVGDSVDVVAVHHYAQRAADTKNYLYGMVAGSGVANWRWPVWVTEVGMFGCNEAVRSISDRGRLGYCYDNGTGDLRFTRDDSQSTYVSALLGAMNAAPTSSRWAKTFYFHSHLEVFGYNNGVDWGLLRGANANNVLGRLSFTAYAQIAGPLGIAGPRLSSGGNATVTATAAVASPSKPYYYAWDYRWCTSGAGYYDCTPEWFPYDSGTAMNSVSVYVSPDDYWVDLRVRQYDAQGRTRVGGASHRVVGPAPCSDPSCTAVLPPSGFAAGATARATADAPGVGYDAPATGRPATAGDPPSPAYR